MSRHPRTEFWVAKVLLHPPQTRQLEMNIGTPAGDERHAAMQARIDAGTVFLLPDMCIAEPVQMFAEEFAAHAERTKRMRDETGSDYRVIVSSEVAS